MVRRRSTIEHDPLNDAGMVADPVEASGAIEAEEPVLQTEHIHAPENTIMSESAPILEPSANELKALDIMRSYMGWSTGAGLLPLPGLDLAAIIGVQVKMLQSMAGVYGVPFQTNMVKPLIVALFNGGGAYMLAAPAASMLKFVPLVGSIAGMLTMPALAAASCYATAKVFIQHFESGGTFLDFDPAKVREYYAQQFSAANPKQ
jgi:uncharacterized protein (DUF697 family)